MSFSRPSLNSLVTRILNDLLSRFGTDDTLRRTDSGVYARVQAAAAHSLYGFVDWASRQFFVGTCDGDVLDRQGDELGLPRTPAAKATGSFTFTTLVGGVIPDGTLVQAFDAVEYETVGSVTASGTSTPVDVQAVVAAAAGNRTTGQTVNLVSPIAGVTAAAVAGELSGGADIETDAAYRARLLARKQQPPHGGASFDYVAWALEVAGVTRAWVYPQELGIGTVSVRFVRDNDASIIPDAGEVATVQAYIDARRPVTAAVTVVAPTADALNFTIDLTLDTPDIRAAVAQELADLLLREAVPGGTILLSHIRQAISNAQGEVDFAMTVPAANVVSATGHMSTMGTVTWL